MPAEDVEFVTWIGDSDTADQSKCPSPCLAYPKKHQQWICTGWLFLFKTNREKKRHSRQKNPVETHPEPLLPSTGVPAPSHLHQPRGGNRACPGWVVPPGCWEGGDPTPSLLSWIRPSPAAGSFGSKTAGEPQQPRASQLRSLAVPCSSGLGLAEVFWHLYWGGRAQVWRDARTCGFYSLI